MSLILLYNALSKGLQHYKYLTESLLGADSISTQVVFNFYPTDSAIVTDNRGATASISFEDILYQGDLISKSPSKSIIDTLQSGDFIVKGQNIGLSDNLILADSKQFNIAAGLRDTLTPEDIISKSTSRIFTDMMLGTDAVSKGLNKIKSESFLISDSLYYQMAIFRSFIETLNLSDSLRPVVVYLRTLADSMLEADVASKDVATFLTAATKVVDTIGKRPNVAVAEIINILDNFNKVSNFNLTNTDIVTIREDLTKGFAYNPADQINPDDSKSASSIKAIEDVVSIPDIISKGFSKSFEDYMIAEDVFAKESIWYKTIDNSVKIDYIIDMGMLRRKSYSGFIWKDSQEGNKRMFGKRKDKKGFNN